MLQDVHLGRDALPCLVADGLLAHPQPRLASVPARSLVRRLPRRRGGPLRARHLPGHLQRRAHRARRRPPAREGVEHHQAVQALVFEDAGAVRDDAGAQRQLLSLHRRLHLHHLCDGHRFGPDNTAGDNSHQHRGLACAFRGSHRAAPLTPVANVMRGGHADGIRSAKRTRVGESAERWHTCREKDSARCCRRCGAQVLLSSIRRSW
mmetsp:Transcript_330/g.659  ORF Transcript_330/g.659 Transcript_330/m.659 type:complete len:207 (+) Transcript_330:579-1199(+)